MKCSFCGGRVEWQGPMSNLTHTKCLSCGRINCQEIDFQQDNEEIDVCDKCGKSFPILSKDVPDDIRQMLKRVTTCTACLQKELANNLYLYLSCNSPFFEP